MANFWNFFEKNRENLVSNDDPGSVALLKALDEGRVVEANVSTYGIPYAITSPTQLAEPNNSYVGELGPSLPNSHNNFMYEDHLNLFNTPEGKRKFLEMRRSDSNIRSSLRAFKTPIKSARWFIKPGVEDDNPKKFKNKHKEIADFVKRNLFDELNVTFSTFLSDVLLHVDYGYMAFEKVYKFEDGKLKWRKLAPRHPFTIDRIDYDSNGGPSGITILQEREIVIPIDKLMIFSFEPEAGKLEGNSLLRSVYKNWFFNENLFKIDGIQKERHGIGIPVIQLPPNYTQKDKMQASELGRNLRVSDRSFIVLPPNFTVEFAELHGNLVNVIDSIEHHAKAINKNVLLPNEVDDKNQSLFNLNTRDVATNICDIINRHGIRQLVDFNFPNVKVYPELVVRSLKWEVEDNQKQSFTVRNYTGSGILRPDDKLEEYVRESLDLPPIDQDTIRDVLSPQNGAQTDPNDPNSGDAPVEGGQAKPTQARVGQPRQSKATNQKIKPQSPTKGIDRNGK